MKVNYITLTLGDEVQKYESDFHRNKGDQIINSATNNTID